MSTDECNRLGGNLNSPPLAAPFQDRYYSDAPQVRNLVSLLVAGIKEDSYVRQLKAGDEAKLVTCVTAIAVNFMCLHFTDQRCLAVALGKGSTAYKGWAFTARTVSRVAEWLEHSGYVTTVKGKYHYKVALRWRTRIKATQQLADLFDEYGVCPSMIQVRERTRLVELRVPKKIREAAIKANEAATLLNTERRQKGLTPVKVPEIPSLLPWPKEARAGRGRMESTLRKINKALQRQFVGIHAPDAAIVGSFKNKKRLVPIFNKSLHRVFTGDTRHNGRFVGAWWLTLPNKPPTAAKPDAVQLRKHIRMSGPNGQQPDRTTELDFDGYHIGMLYAQEGATCKGDPYTLHPDFPDEDGIRPIVKQATLTAINAGTKAETRKAVEQYVLDEFTALRKKHKGDWPKAVSDKMAILWPGCPPLRALLRQIEARHAPIAKHLGSGAGSRCMWFEGEIAERVMVRMIDEHGIAPLCVHDSFIVRWNYEKQLHDVMLQEYKAVMGASTTVSNKAAAKADAGPVDRKAYSLYYRLLDGWRAGTSAGEQDVDHSQFAALTGQLSPGTDRPESGVLPVASKLDAALAAYIANLGG